jgi:hypothetical protein
MPVQPDIRELAGLQQTFTQALLRAGLHVPDAVSTAQGASRERRLGVYRNNVKASLVAALAARFPVICRLVGEEFFEATALVFVERHPPRSPVLADYGAGFAAFLEDFEPIRDLPYLPDVARLEWARQQAFHAADAQPITIERLAALAAGDLGSASLTLHPAAVLVASPWPIVSIWTTNTFDEEVRRLGPDQPGEIALVTRPDQDVILASLPPGADLLAAAIAEGAALGEAADRAQREIADFDLATTLAVLFRSGAVSALLEGKPT